MEEDHAEKLEEIAKEIKDLRTKAHERIERKLDKYKHLGWAFKRITGEDAYGKTKEASDYFFTKLEELNNQLEEIIKQYK